MPSPVDKYYKEVKEGNPDYTEAQAWATAWSIYCKKNPGSEHCHKSEYLKKEGTLERVVERYLNAKSFEPGRDLTGIFGFRKQVEKLFKDQPVKVETRSIQGGHGRGRGLKECVVIEMPDSSWFNENLKGSDLGNAFHRLTRAYHVDYEVRGKDIIVGL